MTLYNAILHNREISIEEVVTGNKRSNGEDEKLYFIVYKTIFGNWKRAKTTERVGAWTDVQYVRPYGDLASAKMTIQRVTEGVNRGIIWDGRGTRGKILEARDI